MKIEIEISDRLAAAIKNDQPKLDPYDGNPSVRKSSGVIGMAIVDAMPKTLKDMCSAADPVCRDGDCLRRCLALRAMGTCRAGGAGPAFNEVRSHLEGLLGADVVANLICGRYDSELVDALEIIKA